MANLVKTSYDYDEETGILELTMRHPDGMVLTETVTDPEKVETILNLLREPEPEPELQNYEDSKCVYGYMTLCAKCAASNDVPPHVDILRKVDGFPTPHCEMCKR